MKNYSKGKGYLQSKGRKVVINREPLHLQVAEQVRRRIVEGALKPEEKIKVSQLAQELGVSLTPLREALKVLSSEQLVELTPNRGARVAPLSIAEIENLFEVMSELEALAARLFCLSLTEERMGVLDDLHQRMVEHFRFKEKTDYFSCNRLIHDMVVQECGNPILIHSRAQLSVRAERVRYFSVSKGQQREEAMLDHEDLMEALRERDENSAQIIWRRHLQRSGKETCDVLRAAQKTAV